MISPDYDQESIEIFCDSQSALPLAKNNGHSKRTKHMAVKLSFVIERVEEGEVSKVHMNKNSADILTKVLLVNKLRHFLAY